MDRHTAEQRIFPVYGSGTGAVQKGPGHILIDHTQDKGDRPQRTNGRYSPCSRSFIVQQNPSPRLFQDHFGVVYV